LAFIEGLRSKDWCIDTVAGKFGAFLRYINPAQESAVRLIDTSQCFRPMQVLFFAAPILSLLLLAAHFFREGAWPLSIACVALVALLALRRPWVTRLLQITLIAGTLEWGWTLFVIAQERLAMGRPWGRLAMILGVVMLVTAASAFAVGRLRPTGRILRSPDR
jgi:hypothetical protein